LPFNSDMIPVTVKYKSGAAGPVSIYFGQQPVRKYGYTSMESMLRSMHSGKMLWSRQYDILNNPASYEQWKHYIGALDELDMENEFSYDTSRWTHRVEFDWPGTDPDIWVRPDIHGRIVYVVDRSNAGPNGEDDRKGYVDNFNAFLVVMKRMRDWTERYDDIDDGAKSLEAKREKNYVKITHPRAFRDFYRQIGRVVQMKTRANGVDLLLDWGGGNDVNSRRNATLKVWINGSGDLSFRVLREDVPVIGSSGSSSTIRGLASQVERIRKKAGSAKKS